MGSRSSDESETELEDTSGDTFLRNAGAWREVVEKSVQQQILFHWPTRFRNVPSTLKKAFPAKGFVKEI